MVVKSERKAPSPARTARGVDPLRRLWGCRTGAGMVEFALAAPILLMAMAAVIEFAMVVGMNALLAGGVREAARSDLEDSAAGGVTREERIARRIGEYAFGILNASGGVTVSTKVYDRIDQIGRPEPFSDSGPANGAYDPGEEFVDVNGNGRWDSDAGRDGPGGAGDMVVYTASVDWPLLTPLLDMVIGTDGKIVLLARLVVRNDAENLAEKG